jgi:hypothetical protein
VYERFLQEMLNRRETESVHSEWSEVLKSDKWVCDFLSNQKLEFPNSNFYVQGVKDLTTIEG